MFGASGQIGHCLLPRLQQAGVVVHALTRGEPQEGGPGVHWQRGALPDRVPALPALDGILGFGPLDGLAHWLGTLTEPPAPVVVATSSMSAVSKQHSPYAEDRALSESLRSNESAFQRECERLGMAWVLIRPTLIYGAGLDHSLTPLARRAARWRLFPLPHARGLRQPVHADDVGEAAWRALRNPAAHGRIFELGGGERLTVADLFARVRASLPVSTVPVPLPMPALHLLAAMLPKARGAIRRMGQDLVADNGDVKTVLALQPRRFSPDSVCWGWRRGVGGAR